jgi:hypothetical protein
MVDTPHTWDEDAVCVHCEFDGAEWHHWKRSTYEGQASSLVLPACSVYSAELRKSNVVRAERAGRFYREYDYSDE